MSFLVKLRSCNFDEKEFLYISFPMNFAKFSEK